MRQPNAPQCPSALPHIRVTVLSECAAKRHYLLTGAWLSKHATMPKECSLIDWNGLNARNKLTADFLSNVDSPADWPAKRFWTEVYRLLPASKPRRGHRLRRCGVDVVYIPSQDDVVDMLREFVPATCCRF